MQHARRNAFGQREVLSALVRPRVDDSDHRAMVGENSPRELGRREADRTAEPSTKLVDGCSEWQAVRALASVGEQRPRVAFPPNMKCPSRGPRLPAKAFHSLCLSVATTAHRADPRASEQPCAARSFALHCVRWCCGGTTRRSSRTASPLDFAWCCSALSSAGVAEEPRAVRALRAH